VLPANVVHRHLRTVHHDAFHVVWPEGMARLHRTDGVERRVIGPDAGIEFERDAHGLPAVSQARRQLLQIEPVARARERGTEAAIRALEYVDNPGETLTG